MSVLDIVFIIPIVWLAYNGFKKGLIIELATLFALLLGIYMSLLFSDITAEFLRETFDFKTKYLSLISFIVTFILVIIAVNLIGKIVSKMVDMVALGFLNKSAGGLFGVLKAVIFLSFIVFFIEKVDKKKVVLSKNITETSLFYPYIKPFAHTAIDIYGEFDFGDIDPEDIKNQVMDVAN
ncbi:MAG: CvpA family protein [Bacteroidales bacterium]|nr:CvpA family protein [Bacteroidales bacterium]